jgi:tetratricopeptide (TPR) repeat protein
MGQNQTLMKYLTMTLLAVLIACGSLFPQKPDRQSTPSKDKRSEAFMDAGDKLADDRRWNEAINAYLQASRIDPQNADVFVKLGDAYMGAAKWTEALVAYKKAVELDPKSADAQYALGDAYNTMRMHGYAFAPLVKAIQLDPTFAEAHYGIGYAYLSGQQYAKSLSFLNNAIKLKPDYEDAHYGLALAYLNLGNQKGLDDERKKLVGLNSALVKKLDGAIEKFGPAVSEALRASAPSPAETPAAPAQTKPRIQATARSVKQNAAAQNEPTTFERTFWESIKDSKDPEDFNYYLRKYPHGEYAALARIKIGQSKPVAPAATAQATPSVTGVAPRRKVASKQNATGQRPELAIVTGHAAPVSALAFSQDGAILATGDGGGAIKLWDARTGDGLRTIAEGESPGTAIRVNSPVTEAPAVNYCADRQGP